MSRDDLLSDLQEEVAARPAAPPSPPPASSQPGVPPLTPTVAVAVTPLRWAAPSVGPSPTGFGLAVRVGPVQVSLGMR